VQLIGNIGNPVLDYLDLKNLSSQKDTYVVFEVSSYMLEGLTKQNYISVLLNIYSDHTDRHNGFENYKNAKLNLLNGSQYNLVRDEILEKYNFTKQELKKLHIHTFGHTGEYSYHDGTFYIMEKQIFSNTTIILQ